MARRSATTNSDNQQPDEQEAQTMDEVTSNVENVENVENVDSADVSTPGAPAPQEAVTTPEVVDAPVAPAASSRISPTPSANGPVSARVANISGRALDQGNGRVSIQPDGELMAAADVRDPVKRQELIDSILARREAEAAQAEQTSEDGA